MPTTRAGNSRRNNNNNDNDSNNNDDTTDATGGSTRREARRDATKRRGVRNANTTRKVGGFECRTKLLLVWCCPPVSIEAGRCHLSRVGVLRSCCWVLRINPVSSFSPARTHSSLPHHSRGSSHPYSRQRNLFSHVSLYPASVLEDKSLFWLRPVVAGPFHWEQIDPCVVFDFILFCFSTRRLTFSSLVLFVFFLSFRKIWSHRCRGRSVSCRHTHRNTDTQDREDF